MSIDTHTHLIVLSDAYGAHLNVSRWRVSFLARGDGMFFKRLAEGSSCTLKTARGAARPGRGADHELGVNLLAQGPLDP